MIRLLAAGAALVLASCGPPEMPHRTVIIGATLIVPDRPPVENAVVIVEAGRIRAAGVQRDVPIPAGSEKVNAAGQFLAAAEGAVIEPGQTANLDLRGRPEGPPLRRMRQGVWITP
ncbi:MAG: hypothetical protein FJW40_10650 [Acidobacteria bacterium]|nr:hypothetical protein [Acidobacteriota bacterium]